MVLRLARAELSEVLRCARHSVGKELHLDPAERFTADGDIEEDDRVWLACHP